VIPYSPSSFTLNLCCVITAKLCVGFGGCNQSCDGEISTAVCAKLGTGYNFARTFVASEGYVPVKLLLISREKL
jgi:hypothetical protein